MKIKNSMKKRMFLPRWLSFFTNITVRGCLPKREREEDGQTRGAAITDIARDINEFHRMPQKWYCTELLRTRRWRLTSAQLFNDFGLCPSRTVSIILTFHQHNSLTLGPIHYKPSYPATKELHGYCSLHKRSSSERNQPHSHSYSCFFHDLD